jgi:hypothetical protein
MSSNVSQKNKPSIIKVPSLQSLWRKEQNIFSNDEIIFLEPRFFIYNVDKILKEKETTLEEKIKFYFEMMKKYGNEKNYRKSIDMYLSYVMTSLIEYYYLGIKRDENFLYEEIIFPSFNAFPYIKEIIKENNETNMENYYSISKFLSEFAMKLFRYKAFKYLYLNKNKYKHLHYLQKNYSYEELYKISQQINEEQLINLVSDNEEIMQILQIEKYYELDYKKLYIFINDLYTRLFTLLFLINKHKDEVCNVKPLIKNKGNISQIFYDISIEIMPKSLYDYTAKIKYEIFPIFNQLIVFNTELKKFILNCKTKFIILPITIFYIDEVNSHANILIYNPNTKEVEIFEPHGYERGTSYIFSQFVLNYFPEGTKYVSQEYLKFPEKYKKHYGIQYVQENEPCTILGHCVSWTIWYADKRLEHPTKTAIEAYNYIMNEIMDDKQKNKFSNYLTELIDKYVKYIIEQRKEALELLDIDPDIKKLLKDEWKL